jgi:mRNA (guanine-N7-)-methyltransferase
MRVYHNNIKSNMIDYYCKDRTVLDLGFGRGGDLGKYQRANVKELWGIEPNEDNLAECRSRLQQKVFSSISRRTHLIQARAQDTQMIVKNLGRKVDNVSSFFSLSFFFFTEEDLNQLVDTIDQALTNGGYFIGTTIMGKYLKELLEDNDGQFRFEEEGFIKWANPEKTEVELFFPGTIVGSQIESLVNFDLLIGKLKEKNIMLVSSSRFNSNPNLSEEENTLNSLYIEFAFVKK